MRRELDAACSAHSVARKLLSFLPFTLQVAIFPYHDRLIGSVVSTMLPHVLNRRRRTDSWRAKF
jgi:hypothetical protein